MRPNMEIKRDMFEDLLLWNMGRGKLKGYVENDRGYR